MEVPLEPMSQRSGAPSCAPWRPPSSGKHPHFPTRQSWQVGSYYRKIHTKKSARADTHGTAAR